MNYSQFFIPNNAGEAILNANKIYDTVHLFSSKQVLVLYKIVRMSKDYIQFQTNAYDAETSDFYYPSTTSIDLDRLKYYLTNSPPSLNYLDIDEQIIINNDVNAQLTDILTILTAWYYYFDSIKTILWAKLTDLNAGSSIFHVHDCNCYACAYTMYDFVPIDPGLVIFYDVIDPNHYAYADNRVYVEHMISTYQLYPIGRN